MSDKNKYDAVDFLERFVYEMTPAREKGKWETKCSSVAYIQDLENLRATALSSNELKQITAPVLFVRAGHGLFAGSEPTVSNVSIEHIKAILNVKLLLDLPNCDHYDILFQVAELVSLNILHFLKWRLP